MKTKIIITLVGLAIAIGHNIWPNITIDGVTIIALVIAIVPWIAPIIKSLELPGGFKIELQDIKTATEKVIPTPRAAGRIGISGGGSLKATGVASRNKTEIAIAKLRDIARNDHRLAVVGVGIEIEKRLLELAERRGVNTAGKTLGQVFWTLRQSGVLPDSIASGLRELIALRNQAAHGAVVTIDAAEWLFEVSPSILEVLDELASSNRPNMDND